MDYHYPYPHPAVTADCVLFGLDDDGLQVLLVERRNEPFKGRWAFPGGFMNMDETVEQCAVRELAEETGVAPLHVEQLITASAVDRDPRERTVSVVFLAVARKVACMVSAGDDARSAQWFPWNEVPPLAFDHDAILRVAVSTLRHRILDPMDACGFLQPGLGAEDRTRIGEILQRKPKGDG